MARRASALVVLGVALRVAPASAQQDTGYVELGVQVQVERGPSRLLVGLARDSTILLPVQPLLELIEIRVSDSTSGRRLHAVLPSANVVFGFDTERGQAFRRRDIRALQEGETVWREGVLYVATGVLAWALEVELTMDWSELLLGIGNTERLPVVARLARERRRQALIRPAATAPPETTLAAARALADGAVLDWATTSSTRGPLRNNTVQLGLGATLLGGSLDVRQLAQTGPQTTATGATVTRTATETHWSWSIAWPERAWLRQARVGEILSGGPRARPVRGALLTNAPFLRSAAFAGERLMGRLPPGWEVELYRAEQLVGFAPVDSTGRYVIDVPVTYGPNPLEDVAYGPRGEVVRRGRTFQVPFDRLPARRLEYSVGGGACRGDPCDAVLNVDLRYGASNRFTFQAGWDRFWRDSLPDLSHPYALASAALTRAVSLTLEGVVNALVRGRVDYDPHADFHLDVGHFVFDTSVVQPILSSTQLRQQTDGSLFWRPAALGGGVFFQLGASHATGAMGTRDLVRASGTGRFAGIRLSLQARDERSRAPGAAAIASGGADLSGDALLARGPRWLRRTLLRAALSADCKGGLARCDPALARVALGMGRQIARTLRLDVGLARERGRPGVQVDVALTSAFPWMRASSRNSYTREFGVAGTQLFEGSILWNRRSGRVDFGTGRNLGRSGFAGVVFLDRNANGLRDDGEPGLDGVLVRVGSDAITTDSAGRFYVWDLVPFEPATIELDTLTLQSPLWVPAAALSRMRPRPNSFQFAALPVLEGGEIGGRVVYGDRQTPLPGAQLILRNVATGAIREITTFTDGTFYTLGIKPGEYYLTLPAALEEELAAQAVPLHFTIGGRDGNRFEGLVVRVQAVERRRR